MHFKKENFKCLHWMNKWPELRVFSGHRVVEMTELRGDPSGGGMTSSAYSQQALCLKQTNTQLSCCLWWSFSSPLCRNNHFQSPSSIQWSQKALESQSENNASHSTMTCNKLLMISQPWTLGLRVCYSPSGGHLSNTGCTSLLFCFLAPVILWTDTRCVTLTSSSSRACLFFLFACSCFCSSCSASSLRCSLPCCSSSSSSSSSSCSRVCGPTGDWSRVQAFYEHNNNAVSTYKLCLVPLDDISVLPLVLIHPLFGVVHIDIICQVEH